MTARTARLYVNGEDAGPVEGVTLSYKDGGGEVSGSSTHLLEGQSDARDNGVYQAVPLGWQPSKVGNRHERRKRKATARRQGR